MFNTKLPYFSRRWKMPKVLYALFIIELAGTIGVLTLFGIADPNLFRTDFWQIGADLGLNSSPDMILYAYANYRPIPKIPFVWSQTLTTFNLVISVLCTFVLLVKATMFVLHIWYPLLSTVTNIILVIMWIVSIVGQAGPDHADPEHPSGIPWYLSKSCDIAEPYGKAHYCRMAKGTFAVTVLMLFIFFLNLLLGIWSIIPSAEERASLKIDMDEMQDEGHSSRTGHFNGQSTEMTASKIAATPRTLAFRTLDKQDPLRSEGSARFA